MPSPFHRTLASSDPPSTLTTRSIFPIGTASMRPSSILEISLWEMPHRKATSTCRHPRRWRNARIDRPIRVESTQVMLPALAHLRDAAGSRGTSQPVTRDFAAVRARDVAAVRARDFAPWRAADRSPALAGLRARRPTRYPAAMRRVPVTFRALAEAQPGPIWQATFEARWEHYRQWFLSDGEAARRTYADSVRILRQHMPELIPTYEGLVDLAGGGDLAARMLTLVDPPPFIGACSQGVWLRDRPVLVRNYDYLATHLEGLIWWTAWSGRRVIGTSDLLWGLLDGMNEAGLAISLTFGGRKAQGHGFGIPLVVRYLLETCDDVGEARRRIERLPFQLAHNLTLVDAGGDHATVYLAPDRRPVFAPTPIATNHQDVLDWPEYTTAVRTHEREALIAALLADPTIDADAFARAFLVPPLLDSAGLGHFGTLYTAAFHPTTGIVEHRWPQFTWRQSFDGFEPGEHTEALAANGYHRTP